MLFPSREKKHFLKSNNFSEIKFTPFLGCTSALRLAGSRAVFGSLVLTFLLDFKSHRYQYPAFAAWCGNTHHPLSRF